MKIEKIDQNKIRIILKQDDLKDKKFDINKILLSTNASQNLFLELLNKAEKELDFYTDGHKLLIEAYSQDDDFYIITITKYILSKSKFKKEKIKTNSCRIYAFDTLEDFCAYCQFVYKAKNTDFKKLYKNSSLYFYNNTYYLVLEKIHYINPSFIILHSSLLEFSKLVQNPKTFKYKLKEHGKIIIKNNVINTGIKYFS